MCSMNPKFDIIFRKLFGSEENSDILLSLINAVLDKEHSIKKIKIRNPYNFPDYANKKTSVLDVSAEDENGVLYDIEMQMGNQSYYGQRALYYWGKEYVDQLDSGGLYSKLKKTIVISFLDFGYFKDEPHNPRYRRVCGIRDLDTFEKYDELNYLELYFIELNKLDKNLSDLTSNLEKWITFFNNSKIYNENNIPKEFSSDPAIAKAIGKLEKMFLTDEERLCYEVKKKEETDIRTSIFDAREKGMKKGLKKGLEKGMKQGKIEEKIKIAEKMLLKGIELELIVEMTELSPEEIKRLR